MSVQSPERTAPGPSSSATSASPRGVWRAARGPLAFTIALLAVAVLVSIGGRPAVRGDLDPESAGPEGTRALVRVLEDQGAPVTIARGTDDAVAAAEDAGPRSVLVLVQSHRLTAGELRRIAAAPGDKVLVRPTGPALDALAPGVAVSGRGDGGAVPPRCALPAAEAAGGADLDDERYRGGDTACYRGRDGASLVQTAGRGRAAGTTTTVLGGDRFLRNEALGQAGNAALAMDLTGLAGERPRPVVYAIPAPPVEGGQRSLWDLTPLSVRLSLGAVAAALLLVALWRGRRLGPLVAERLPVVVRAAETTEGRAGLYASRRARDRAAAALRAGFIGRVRPSLGLGPDAAPSAVADAIAARNGEDPRRLGALLYGTADDPYPSDDAGLVRLADELDRLGATLR